MNFFTSRSARSASNARIAEIRALVVKQLGLDDEATVMISEWACTEMGCPPIETIVAILCPDKPARKFKIHKAIGDIKDDELLDLLGNRNLD